MHTLLTGLHGTVAPVLAQALQSRGHTIAPWHRDQVAVDDPVAIHDFVRREQPAWCCHLANGSPQWAAWLAQACAAQGVKMLYTSSVSVFASTQLGPLTVDVPPEPADEYGRYKLECEQRVRAAHPGALVVRLGWQIGLTVGGNQMVDYLDRTFRAEGRLAASTAWYQACSFLPDTAHSLLHLLENAPGGVYHLDGNPGLNFFEIVTGLNRRLGQPWVVEPTASPALTNRLLDPRVPVTPITRWFPATVL